MPGVAAGRIDHFARERRNHRSSLRRRTPPISISAIGSRFLFSCYSRRFHCVARGLLAMPQTSCKEMVMQQMFRCRPAAVGLTPSRSADACPLCGSVSRAAGHESGGSRGSVSPWWSGFVISALAPPAASASGSTEASGTRQGDSNFAPEDWRLPLRYLQEDSLLTPG